MAERNGNEQRNSAEALRDDQLEDVGGGTGWGDCGVPENQFPQLGRCARRSVAAGGSVYQALCPQCTVWTSLPEGATLEVRHIFKCTLYGYGKRIKANDPG